MNQLINQPHPITKFYSTPIKVGIERSKDFKMAYLVRTFSLELLSNLEDIEQLDQTTLHSPIIKRKLIPLVKDFILTKSLIHEASRQEFLDLLIEIERRSKGRLEAADYEKVPRIVKKIRQMLDDAVDLSLVKKNSFAERLKRVRENFQSLTTLWVDPSTGKSLPSIQDLPSKSSRIANDFQSLFYSKQSQYVI